MARPERFELPTLCFEGRCSIQLSYGRVVDFPHLIIELRSGYSESADRAFIATRDLVPAESGHARENGRVKVSMDVLTFDSGQVLPKDEGLATRINPRVAQRQTKFRF
jgi:hypothetical protein